MQNVLDRIPIDLKKKYNAEWALVTGTSSGIGLAMTRKLCKQSLNVVMVALDDDMLKKSVAAIKAEFPKCEIRQVRCRPWGPPRRYPAPRAPF